MSQTVTVRLLFPGFIAGASLKHRHAHRPGERDHLFPGFIAGASLKPDITPHQRFEVIAYSPALLLGPH